MRNKYLIVRLDQLNSRLDQLNTRLDQLNTRPSHTLFACVHDLDDEIYDRVQCHTSGP